MKLPPLLLTVAVFAFGCQPAAQTAGKAVRVDPGILGTWTGKLERGTSQRYPDTITFDFRSDGRAMVKVALTGVKFDHYDIAYATVKKEASWMLTSSSLRLRILGVSLETTATGAAKKAFEKATPDIKRGEFEAMQYRVVKVGTDKLDFVDTNNHILHLVRQS